MVEKVSQKKQLNAQEKKGKVTEVAFGFLEFIGEQGIVSLAIGFVLGGAVSKLVDSIVKDLINPVLGIILGATGDLKSASWVVGGAEIKYGNFLTILIDFMLIAFVIYLAVRLLGIKKLDKIKVTAPKK